MIPDLGAYYTADQMRGLALSQPVLERASNGNFLLNLKLLESTDLINWTPRTLVPADTSVINGGVQVEVTPLNGSTQFYRVQTLPNP